jgi:poly(A) polymerase
VRQFIAETPPEQVRPERLITGDDLQAMGFRPGPLFSQILGTVEDAQLEGQVQTQQEAAQFVLKQFGAKKDRV